MGEELAPNLATEILLAQEGQLTKQRTSQKERSAQILAVGSWHLFDLPAVNDA